MNRKRPGPDNTPKYYAEQIKQQIDLGNDSSPASLFRDVGCSYYNNTRHDILAEFRKLTGGYSITVYRNKHTSSETRMRARKEVSAARPNDTETTTHSRAPARQEFHVEPLNYRIRSGGPVLGITPQKISLADIAPIELPSRKKYREDRIGFFQDAADAVEKYVLDGNFHPEAALYAVLKSMGFGNDYNDVYIGIAGRFFGMRGLSIRQFAREQKIRHARENRQRNMNESLLLD